LGSTDTRTSKKLDKILKRDLVTTCGDVSKNSEDTWRSRLKLYIEEEAKYEAIQCTKNKYQMCVIINDASKETNNENNPATNPKQGVNRRADGETRQAAGREKVHLSGEEWRMIKTAVNHGAAIPADSRREVLMGYQYALYQQKKQLL
jgi:hypothetical protein